MAEPELQRCCRICAVDHDAGVLIFGDHGQHIQLEDSIRKYLRIEISSNDRLPKMVCVKCFSQIDAIRVFAEMASQTQITLKNQLEILDQTEKSEVNYVSKLNLKFNASRNSDTKENDVEENYILSDNEDITELEVPLDPMMFLDSHTDDSQTNDSKMNYFRTVSPEEECATLTKIENPTEKVKINALKISLKPCNVKNEKVLPDLKPIKGTKLYVSPDQRPYACTLCTKSFLSSIALHNHLWLHLHKDGVKHIPNEKPKCPVCHREVVSLKTHMEIHRQKAKYSCDKCFRVFKTQLNLHRHKQYHSDEVHTCKVCGRVYPTNSTLRAHSVTHSDARPHTCTLCNKTFKRNQDLKFHINQHTGAKPYRCPYCPKAFASSGNCFSHRKRMHSKEIEKEKKKLTQYEVS